ncbi:MAG: phenylalanine--tRNA ligase subunit beta [Chloroflexota bacterium]|nr:phenylalanine--tRNA ligase subunit beta [Chloroflexota bacterium]MDE2895137.1 phenylalanine--tRNA ligase subunit beta [Chloroflexota bacterium]
MDVPLKWLARYVDWDLSVEELAHRLSMAGAEVERIKRSGGDWDQVVVGRVAVVEQHPNADRLRLATIEFGADEPLQVVCGAPNLAEGQTIAFAQVGAQLIDPSTREPRKLRKGKIRGVTSLGMVCSERELGLSDEHEGILELETDAELGTPLADVLGDVVLDVKPTPNRPDHFSILGIAREVAALTEGAVREPSTSYAESGTPAERRTSVEIEDAAGCPRYTAILIDGVKVGPSPQWMQDALSSAGMRPINNVVDVTNYVMLEWGQPLHAFDFELLRGGRIVVRRARPEERLELLDGSELELLADDLVIADAERAVALAGIMGGAESEISDATTTILLETANFQEASIRRSSARHTESGTEASRRFEKSLNPELAELAARRAAALIVETAGGSACSGIVDAYPGRSHQPQVVVTQRRIEQVLGIQPSVEAVRGLLSALGISNRWLPPDRFAVSCPPWRSDIAVADDVVEEIGRVIGYDNLPSEPLPGAVPDPGVDPERELSERIRDILTGLGLREVITYVAVEVNELALTASDSAHVPATVRLQNPMNAARDRMRNSLRPAGLRTFALNQREARGGLGLYEVGKTFHSRAGRQPDEDRMVLALIGGEMAGSVHGEPERMLDFYDAKGVLEQLGSGLGTVFDLSAEVQDDALASGETAAVNVRGKQVGILGKVAPGVATRFGVQGDVFALEMSIGALAPLMRDDATISSPSVYPSAVEDLALIVDSSIRAGDLASAICGNGLVESAELFDIYTGDQIPAGQKSLAFRVMYRSPDRTLSDRDVEKARRGIVRRLESQYGATLRDS